MSAYFSFFIVVIATGPLQLSAAQASSLVSLKGATFIVALFVPGTVVARLGTRGEYAACFALLAASLLTLGLAGGPDALRAGSLALGVGLGTLQIATLTQFARVGARTGHGKASAISALFGPSGGVFSSLLGASLGKAFGLQATFLVLAAMACAACVICRPTR